MVEILKIFILTLSIFGTEGGFTWSSPDYAEQAKRTTCLPFQKYELASLKTNADSPAINRTSLGAVLNAEVCGGLCCEMENCDLAEFNKNRQCYAVQCSSLKSCDVGSNGESVILTFGRKARSDVWTRSFTGNTRSNIITNSAASQKSFVPPGDTTKKDNTEKTEEKPMDALLREELSNVQRKEAELKKTWTMEEMAKATFNSKKSQVETDKENANLGKEIQSITGEHYLKADDKDDITALQENETSIAHSKSHHRRDARHNIISPITIGAFTCMAVIAVSGFAMAIIKYKKEKKEVEDKQTQLP